MVLYSYKNCTTETKRWSPPLGVLTVPKNHLTERIERGSVRSKTEFPQPPILTWQMQQPTASLVEIWPESLYIKSTWSSDQILNDWSIAALRPWWFSHIHHAIAEGKKKRCVTKKPSLIPWNQNLDLKRQEKLLTSICHCLFFSHLPHQLCIRRLSICLASSTWGYATRINLPSGKHTKNYGK